jgi:5'-nucleotidase
MYEVPRGGDRVGIVAITNPDSPRLAHTPPELRFQPVEASLRTWIKAITDGSQVDKIVLVSNAGIEFDKQLAATVTGIDVIVSGNTHGQTQPLASYPLVLHGPTGQPVLLVQTVGHGRDLGRLDVTFDQHGVPKSWKGQLIQVRSTDPEDQQVKAAVASFAVAPGPATATSTQAAR